jgi:predicted transcriptional regulator with HTH domain
MRPSSGSRARRLIAAPMILLALVACGARFTPPAAVVNGHSITQAALQEEVRELLTDPRLAQQLQGPGGVEQRRQLTREILRYLIDLQVAQDYAMARRIRVSPAEVEGQLGLSIQQVGGRQRFDRLLAARGLTESEVRRNVGQNLLLRKVEESVVRAAPNGQTASAQAIFTAWLRDRIQRGDVRVNPRFGALDPRTAAIEPITSTSLLPG